MARTSKIETKWEKGSTGYNERVKMYDIQDMAAATKLTAGGQEFPFELVIGLTAERMPAVEVHSGSAVYKMTDVKAGIKSGQFELGV